MKRGKFIVLEGIDGSGKTTQASLLFKKLKEKGIAAQLCCEPTERPMGKLLRNYLKGEYHADELAVAALFTADRLDHITSPDHGLQKLLGSGIHVICDRYYFSSYAYNCHGYGVDTVVLLNAPCSLMLRPDLTIFVDIPPDMAMKRIHENRNTTEIYENFDYLCTVRGRYLEAFEREKDKENVMIVDGTRSPEEISSVLWERVCSVLTL